MNTNLFVSGTDTIVQIFDPALEKKTAGLCDLIIAIENSSFQIALLEKKTNRFLALEVFNFEKTEDFKWKDYFENISGKSAILKNYEFSKVKICLTSLQFTLVPESLLHPGDEQTYFKMNFKNHSNLEVKHSHINVFSLFTVYGIDRELQAVLTHLFQDPKIIHHSEILLHSILRIGRNDSNKKLLLNIRKNDIDILIAEGKKVILLNSFNRNSEEDVLYYLLFTCEQLNIDTESISVYLSGEIEPESALYKLLYKYIRKITFVNHDRTLSFGENFEEIPANFYYTLFNLPLCE